MKNFIVAASVFLAFFTRANAAELPYNCSVSSGSGLRVGELSGVYWATWWCKSGTGWILQKAAVKPSALTQAKKTEILNAINAGDYTKIESLRDRSVSDAMFEKAFSVNAKLISDSKPK